MVVRLMRIIAGLAKGRRIRGPAGRDTRPMMDRAREALFSSLGPLIPGSRVLDLYAGSGALGLESLSRGAAGATFVEHGRLALEALRANVEALDLGGEVVARDVGAFLEQSPETFDVVFVDPPYALELASVEEILKLVSAAVSPGGTVVLHRPDGEDEPAVPDGLRKIDDRRYGGTRLRRYERNLT